VDHRWAVPLPTIDPQIVARSGATVDGYGSSFRYSHFAGAKTLRYAAGGAVAVGVLALAAQVGPVRRWLGDRVPPGAGPDEERRAKGWFRVDSVAEGDGRMVHTRVSGGDPGYGETAKMLAESALCLALDDLPETSGSVTTATAMGDALRERLTRNGIAFRVL
jgi:saccharopine dehydrogenase (NAD+, L-glutamate forming)